MKFLLTISFLIYSVTSFAQSDNLSSIGIPDSALQIKDPGINKYRSTIDFPMFAGWSKNGKKMLFNGGKSVYSMKGPTANINELHHLNKSFDENLSPDQKSFLYFEDTDGDENYRIFLYEIAGNNITAISDTGCRSYDPYWSPDGKQIVYKSNKRDKYHSDLYLREMKAPFNEKLIFKDVTDEGVILDWDKKNNRILLSRIISENDKELYLLDLETQTSKQINPGKNQIAYSAALFLYTKDAALVVSDEQSEFRHLHLYDFKNSTFSDLTKTLNRDINDLAYNSKSGKIVFVVNENGYSGIYQMDTNNFNYRKIDGIPEGVVKNLKMSPDGKRFAFNLYGSTFFKKVFVYDLTKAHLEQCVQKGKSYIENSDFVKPEYFTYQSWDKDSGKFINIPAFIYLPKNNKQNRDRFPVLIDVHGGPEYQAVPTFNRWFQYLLNELGIAVIVPNVRGSNGYGKSYMKADDQILRENAVDDIGALLNWIASQNKLDPSRVAISGESYGGYVSLSSLIHFPDQLKCAIDIVGITDFVGYLENTAAYRKDLRRVEFGDERITEIRDFLNRISPYNKVDQILAPVFIAQGYNDPRVYYKQSEDIVQRLRENNQTVWYLMAKNEGHGFQNAENINVQRNSVIIFLKKYLLE
ncbi:alpha/beta fold hydrolase [Fluviicola sp.]|uniref:S9 family peptidase n=1 Tax=Fluviicola sp. TaxID=1917219 RepID=UPI0026029ED8|nr:alpha/beta fold hydrolase [Fluviicola sp.]